MKKVLGALLLSVALAPAVAFVTSWTMSKLWTWFEAKAYGGGPSIGQWYGISLIFGLLLAPAIMEVARDKVEQDSVIETVIGRSLGVIVGCLIVLGVAWCVGSVTGWMA